MKITKSLNQKGFSHFLIPLLIVVAIAIGGTYMLVSSHAATPRPAKTYKPRHYSKTIRQNFALATSNYWSSPVREDQARHAKNSYVYLISDPEVTCKPGNVKIMYYNDPSDQAVAYSYMYGALKQHITKGMSKADKKAVGVWNSKQYCRMFFNLAYQRDIKKLGDACVTFIHEYGHMLGRIHNDNAQSPMYVGYALQDGKQHESFAVNNMNIIKKSLCTPFGNGLFR